MHRRKTNIKIPSMKKDSSDNFQGLKPFMQSKCSVSLEYIRSLKLYNRVSLNIINILFVSLSSGIIVIIFVWMELCASGSAHRHYTGHSNDRHKLHRHIVALNKARCKVAKWMVLQQSTKTSELNAGCIEIKYTWRKSEGAAEKNARARLGSKRILYGAVPVQSME